VSAIYAHIDCRSCDGSGSVEGPDAGWYEVACAACKGRGFILLASTLSGSTEPPPAASQGVEPQ
jgi:DnaJ-class molecular chaperone